MDDFDEAYSLAYTNDLVRPAASAKIHRMAEHGNDTPRVLRFTSRVVGLALLPFGAALGTSLFVVSEWMGNRLPIAQAADAYKVFHLRRMNNGYHSPDSSAPHTATATMLQAPAVWSNSPTSCGPWIRSAILRPTSSQCRPPHSSAGRPA